MLQILLPIIPHCQMALFEHNRPSINCASSSRRTNYARTLLPNVALGSFSVLCTPLAGSLLGHGQPVSITGQRQRRRLFEMNLPVATPTERDEVLLGVVAKPAPGLDVVNFQAHLAATHLATPSVTIQYSLTQLLIRLQIQTKPRMPEGIHGAVCKRAKSSPFLWWRK